MQAYRFVRLGAAAALILFLGACGDAPSRPTGPVAPPPRAALTAPTPGTCTTVDNLLALAASVFGAGSPNYNSVRGKIENLNHQIQLGNITGAKEKAFDIGTFVLDKNAEKGLPGSDQNIVDFVNSVFCFAGLALVITDPSNSFLVYPSDEPQVLVSDNGLAGTSLPGNPVSEPTLITIEIIPPGQYPTRGTGPLETKLDQYPGFVAFHKSSENALPFAEPVVVAVCAPTGLGTSLRARLRLGHDASSGFEITPPADGSFLQCPTETAQSGVRGFLKRVASMVLPKVLYARQDDFFGGVGGTAGEYSEFGLVDSEVSFGGGVGGTAGEYIRGSMRASLEENGACTSVEAPIGSPLSASCLPLITIQTAEGTVLSGVTVSWAVTGGNGQISDRTGGACVGGFGTTVENQTSEFGKIGVCWTLGDAGLNTVTATPSATGDAPPGTVFNPASTNFVATANPAVGVAFVQQPPLQVTAGAPFDVTAVVVDKNGDRVFGSSDLVTLTPNKNSFAGGAASVSVNAVGGLATFEDLSITAAAAGYALTATSAVIAAPNTAPVSDPFDVVAGAASAISIVQGDNQTAAAGATLPINPTVRVADAYDNPVAGVAVDWIPGLSSSGIVGQSPTSTGASGQASTTWAIGDGENQLEASLASDPTISVVFNATGTSSLSVLNECKPAAGGDPINDPGKTYAFYVPNPGRNKTIREVQVYLSSAGKANVPTEYLIGLSTQIGTFDPAVSPPVMTTTNVFLRGNNSERRVTTFTLATPIVGVQNGPDIMMQLHVLTNPDDSKITFNTGECSPNANNCKPPKSCSVSEVNSLTPYPNGTLYRKSVALVIKG